MKKNYESPIVEIVEVAIEKGFATSNGGYGEPGEAGGLEEGPIFNF